MRRHLLPPLRPSAVRALGVILALLILPACAVKLAPDYDKTLVDGLTKVNEDAMTLFASVSSGTTAESFPERRDKYNSLIGRVDALRIQSNARPVPRPLVAQVLAVGPNPSTPPELLETPTTGILERLGGTLTSMRDHDKKVGLTPMLVVGFKRRFETSMDQALTYEKALQR